MVTAYYIMKMAKKNKSIDISEYYSKLCVTDLKEPFHKNKQTCRICLKAGTVPIYGIGRSCEVVEALTIFGNIKLDKDDDYPKHLCQVCNKFIMDAISFRTMAKKADDVLKQSIKCDDYDDFHDNGVEYEIEVSEQCPIKTEVDELGPTRHIESDKEKKNVKVQCTVCHKIVTSAYYKEHITMHDPNHHKYICDICGRSFRLRCSYHNHRLRHRTDFSFKCQFCPYKGRYKELLKTHMRTHTGDYRYMCTECPARFLFKSNLNRHVLIKHKEPQYKCDVCKRAFHTEVMLQKHNEVDHLGFKNHTCNLCGKAFGYRNAMMKHQRRVHKREKLSFSRMPTYLQVEKNNQGIDV